MNYYCANCDFWYSNYRKLLRSCVKCGEKVYQGKPGGIFEKRKIKAKKELREQSQ